MPNCARSTVGQFVLFAGLAPARGILFLLRDAVSYITTQTTFLCWIFAGLIGERLVVYARLKPTHQQRTNVAPSTTTAVRHTTSLPVLHVSRYPKATHATAATPVTISHHMKISGHQQNAAYPLRHHNDLVRNPATKRTPRPHPPPPRPHRLLLRHRDHLNGNAHDPLLHGRHHHCHRRKSTDEPRSIRLLYNHRPLVQVL